MNNMKWIDSDYFRKIISQELVACHLYTTLLTINKMGFSLEFMDPFHSSNFDLYCREQWN